MEGEIDRSMQGPGGSNVIPNLEGILPFYRPERIIRPGKGIPRMPNIEQDPYNPGSYKLRKEPPGYHTSLPFYFG